MKHREQLRPLGFDEQRALEDLQKLHRDIQRARGDREQAEAEFDSFVKGFRPREPQPAAVHREPRPAPAPPPMVAREARPEPPALPAPSPPPSAAAPPAVAPMPPLQVEPAAQAPSPLPRQDLEPLWPAPDQVMPRTDAPESQAPQATTAGAAPEIAPAPSPARRVHPLLAVGVVALVLAAGLFALFGGGDEPGTVRDVPAGAVPPEPEPQPPAAETPQPAAAPPQPGVNLELITRRTVWVRVTVDGRREIERELPGGERIPLHAEQSIVIRAGDAGAVAIRRGSGAEVRLGEDGIVANRTFTAERRPEGATPR